MPASFARSLPGRALDALSALPARLLRPLARGRTRRWGGLLPHQWLFCLGFAAMLCTPHAVWNNLYGAVFAGAVLLAYWWDCAAEDTLPLGLSFLGPGVPVFLIMCILCTLWADFPLGSLRVAVFYFAGFAMSYVAAASFRERAAAEILRRWMYGILLFTAAYGLIVYFTGHETYYVPVEGRYYARLSATMEHGINYSEAVAMLFPVCLVWAAGRKNRAAWVLALSALALPMTALVLTYGRTGWVALGLALLILLWFWNKKLLLPAIALGGVVLLFLPESVQMRFFSMLHFNDASASGRFTLWRECLAMLRDHWIAGVGLGPENFYQNYLPYATGLLDFQPPHANMGYLEIFLSTGVVGFAGFLWFFFGVFVRLRRGVRRLPKGGERWELYGLTAALAGAALANIPEYIWFYPRVLFLWCVLFGLALGRAGAAEDRPPEGRAAGKGTEKNFRN